MLGYIYILYFIVGLFAGCLSGLFGIGGGLLIVPILTWALSLHKIGPEYAIHLAIATSLAVMVFTSLASTFAHYIRKSVHFNTAITIGIGVILGSVLGAFISFHTRSGVLKILLALIEIAIGLYLFFSKPSQKDINEFKPTLTYKLIFIVFGFAVAFLANLLGIGGGVFFVPFLIYFGLPTHHAVGTSAACTVITSVSGTIVNLVTSHHIQCPQSVGFIYIPALIGITIGSVIAAPIGAHIAHKMSGKVLRRIFALLLVAIGVALWI